MSPTIEDAISLAAQAHRGQVDKGGKPYVLHVLRVMLQQREETTQIVGVLHDVIEDTTVTLLDLREAGYSETICAAVDCLTRREGQSYEDMIALVAANPVAVLVKLADLEDNMDMGRFEDRSDAALARLEKYKTARARLQSSLHNR